MTNYSPVSLSTISSKVLEKAASGRLSLNQCPKNILITECYGFGKGYQLNMLPSLYSNVLTKK